MPSRSEQLLGQIRRLVQNPASDPAIDAVLLRRFVSQRDEEAFTALVHRHGPLVLGVCQRLLHDRHEAEEASQAVWLVLARKAATVRPPSRLAAWLYGVARHVALNARRADVRRLRHEMPGLMAEPPASQADPLSEPTVRELLLILDEELQRLPQACRLALILCALEGRSTEEAARQLGWTPGSVRGRLVRGRALLHRRLLRRGLALPTALATVEASRSFAPAAISAALAAQIARGAAAFAAARTVGVPEQAGQVATLVETTLRGMAMAKVKAGLAVALVVGAILATAGVAHRIRSAGKPGNGAGITGGPVPIWKAPAGDTNLRADALPEGAVARLGTVCFSHGDTLDHLFFSLDGKQILSEGSGCVRISDAATGRQLAQLSLPQPWPWPNPLLLAEDGKSLILLAQDYAARKIMLSTWDLCLGKEVHRVKVPASDQINQNRDALSSDGQLYAERSLDVIQVFEVATGKELCQLHLEGRQIQSMIFGGKDRLVTVDRKGTIEVWEARTGKVLRQFEHGVPPTLLAASADGTRLATLEYDTRTRDAYRREHVIHVWDLPTGTRKQLLQSQPGPDFTRMRFSPDNKLLLASANPSRVQRPVTIWDVETGQQIRELDGAYGPFAISPDGSRVVAGANKFELWDLTTGRRLSGEDSSYALADAVFFASRSDRVFTISASSISTWDGRTGRRLQSTEVPAYPFPGRQPGHSPDGRFALIAGTDVDMSHVEIVIWDVAGNRRLRTLPPRPGSSLHFCTAFSADSSLLALREQGTWKEVTEGIIHLWDVRTGKEVGCFQEAKAGLFYTRLAFAPDGRTLIVIGRSVVGIDIASGKELFSWHGELRPTGAVYTPAGGKPVMQDDPWSGAAVSPDGLLLAGIESPGKAYQHPEDRLEDRIVLYEARTGRVLRRWNGGRQHFPGYRRLEFSPDSRLLAISDLEGIHVWDVHAAKEVYQFGGYRGEIRSLSFSPDNRRLATACSDSTVLLWDLTGRPGSGSVPQEKSRRRDVEKWWAELSSEDAHRAQLAVWRLAEVPELFVPFLRQHLRPATDDQARQIQQYLADLDSDTFAVRQKAVDQLARLGLEAVPALREALTGNRSAEMRHRLEELLQRANRHPTAQTLRTLRALAALEHANSPEAERFLSELAGGTPAAWLTQQAKAIRARPIASRATP